MEKLSKPPVLELRDFSAHFHTRRGTIKAVNHVNFSIFPGETLGIVGESGCGKSVTHLSYLGLLPSPPLRIVGGQVLFKGSDLLEPDKRTLRSVLGNRVTMIFQEPMTSLNPYMKIGKQLIEPLLIHHKSSKKDAKKQALDSLAKVGLPEPERAMESYPHEFSGGMRQRVMIAMALTTRPDILIADEPTTALDVTVQAQILELMKKIQRETGMAIILITHDLGVIASVADRVAVMYAGSIMEQGSCEGIFRNPGHPYTLALLRSTPRMDREENNLPVIDGNPPDLSNLPDGCPFFVRCAFHKTECANTFPTVKNFENNHHSFCHITSFRRDETC